MPGKALTLVDQENILAAVDEEMRGKQNRKVLKRRARVFKLRVQGYTLMQITELLSKKYGVSQLTIQRDLEWARANFQVAQESADQIRVMSVMQLQYQYGQLAPHRAAGDIAAHKVSLDILQAIAKLMGLDKMTVEVQQVLYDIVGVDMDQLR